MNPLGLSNSLWQLGRAQVTTPPPWWLSGGISAANAKRAYAPKGAASLAASYVNLANPGTYDLTVAKNSGSLAWDATNGLKLDYCVMATGMNLAGTNKQWSVILRFSNVVGYEYMFGAHSGNDSSTFGVHHSPIEFRYRSSGYVGYTNSTTNNVIAIASNKGYMAGLPVVTISVGSAIDAGLTDFAIGGRKTTTGWEVLQRLYVQAFAAYDTPLTDAQVSAVTTAMLAL